MRILDDQHLSSMVIPTLTDVECHVSDLGHYSIVAPVTLSYSQILLM